MLIKNRLEKAKAKKHRQHVKLFKRFLREHDIASRYYTYMMCIHGVDSVDRYLRENSVTFFFPDFRGYHETEESIYSFQIFWTYMDAVWLQHVRYYG